jgi:hypothetical protein
MKNKFCLVLIFLLSACGSKSKKGNDAFEIQVNEKGDTVVSIKGFWIDSSEICGGDEYRQFVIKEDTFPKK